MQLLVTKFCLLHVERLWFPFIFVRQTFFILSATYVWPLVSQKWFPFVLFNFRYGTAKQICEEHGLYYDHIPNPPYPTPKDSKEPLSNIEVESKCNSSQRSSAQLNDNSENPEETPNMSQCQSAKTEEFHSWNASFEIQCDVILDGLVCASTYFRGLKPSRMPNTKPFFNSNNNATWFTLARHIN